MERLTTLNMGRDGIIECAPMNEVVLKKASAEYRKKVFFDNYLGFAKNHLFPAFVWAADSDGDFTGGEFLSNALNNALVAHMVDYARCMWLPGGGKLHIEKINEVRLQNEALPIDESGSVIGGFHV